MGSLFVNFIKRAFIIPIIVTAIVLGAAYYAVPKTLNYGNTQTETVAPVDISKYSVKDYNDFKELSDGDYIGTVSCKNINLPETAVVYHSDNNNSVYVAKDSEEPWKSGSIILVGTDTPSQFGKFYNSKTGDKISIEFYSKDTYTYKISRKVTGVTEKQIKKYEKDSNLIIAVPYNDFSDLGNSFFYTLYIARKA